MGSEMCIRDSLLPLLGPEIQDPSTETFELFSQPQPSQDLGMLDPKSQTVEVTIHGRDLTIKQSPSILQSNREGGTTAAALWRTSVRFTEWLASPKNALFEHGVLGAESTVIELGAGIAGLTSSVLASRVRRVVATDQQYALKLLRENVGSNAPVLPKGKKSSRQHVGTVDVVALDWETDSIPSFLAKQDLVSGVDAIVACDCVYNYALIQPLIQACADICKSRQEHQADGEQATPTAVIVAQQLRQPDVFEQWLEAFVEDFMVWRLPEAILGPDLGESSGFCVHAALLS